MIVKHSVIVIAYNQEKLISRALDSLISQKEFIYEIIISDDCSTDKTYEIIYNYYLKYPSLIRPFRNETNLGIFGNIESNWEKVNGDLIWFLSGDDEFCNGVFNEANLLIINNNIDYENNAITLYFDYKCISPKGKTKIKRNYLVKKHNPISLKLRQLICNRTTCVSKEVLKQYYPVRKDIGIFADGLIDIQTQIFSKENYYKEFIGSIYYTSIGISSKTDKKLAAESAVLSLEQLKKNIGQLSESDENWILYRQLQHIYSIHPTFYNFCKYFKMFFLVIRDYYGIDFITRELRNIAIDSIRLVIFKLKLKKI